MRRPSSGTIAIIISFLSLIISYYGSIFTYRELLITIVPPPQLLDYSDTVAARNMAIFDINSVIQNTGDSTEVILDVSYRMSSMSGERICHRAGPFVLKAGDAREVPLNMPFDALVALTQEFQADVETFIDISYLDTNHTPSRLVIPLAKIQNVGYEDNDHINVRQNGNGNLRDGRITILSSYQWLKKFEVLWR